MGEARTKRELKEQKRAERKARQEMMKTIPIRIIKGLAGAFLWPLVITFVVSKGCFKDNEWPWEGS